MSRLEKIKASKVVNKHNIFYSAIGLVAFGIILFYMSGGFDKPSTYDELRPMMDEAYQFDNDATEVSGAFDGLENQMTKEQYDALTYEPYRSSAEVQASVIAEINAMDDMIEARGGINSYDDLQRVKNLPVTDVAGSQELEAILKANSPREKVSAEEFFKDYKEYPNKPVDAFGNIIE